MEKSPSPEQIKPFIIEKTPMEEIGEEILKKSLTVLPQKTAIKLNKNLASILDPIEQKRLLGVIGSLSQKESPDEIPDSEINELLKNFGLAEAIEKTGLSQNETEKLLSSIFAKKIKSNKKV